MINNNLQHISVGLDEVLTDMLTRCMLNPDNKDFYIGNLTLDKVKQYFAEMPQGDVSVDVVFWSAFSRAQAQYLKEQAYLEQAYYESATLDDIACELSKHGNKSYYGSVCPKCGCRDYITGVACPNCDYIED